MNGFMVWFNTCLLFQEAGSQNTFMVSIWSVLVFIGGFLLNVGGAIMLLKSATMKENLKQIQDLAKTYKDSFERSEKEVKDLEKKLEITEEHCRTFEKSYNAVAGITIRELLNFAELISERDALDRRCKRLEDELFSMRNK